MPPRRQPFTYIPLANIEPISCARCGKKAHPIWHSPLPAGLMGEMCTFECDTCGKKTKMIVEEQSSHGPRRVFTPTKDRGLKSSSARLTTPRQRLILVHATHNRPSKKRPEDDYDIWDDKGRIIGRIFRAAMAPKDRPWFWTTTKLESQRPTDRGYALTREDAMTAFKHAWRTKQSATRVP
jgi:hypothetical protein